MLDPDDVNDAGARCEVDEKVDVAVLAIIAARRAAEDLRVGHTMTAQHLVQLATMGDHTSARGAAERPAGGSCGLGHGSIVSAKARNPPTYIPSEGPDRWSLGRRSGSTLCGARRLCADWAVGESATLDRAYTGAVRTPSPVGGW